MTQKNIMNSGDKDKDKYEALKKEYQEFAYVVSHDLYAPLRQINGFTNLLLDNMGEKLSQDQQTYKDMIFKALKDAERSLDVLLEFSRLDTDEKNFEDVPVSLLVNNALKMVRFQINESDAVVEVKSLPQNMTGDEKKLTKALYAILDNALKFQPENQQPHITISAEENDSIITFCIQDNGIGIEEENQERIFTILRRLHANDTYPGRGAGLSLAKKIAEIHGGEIWLESKQGEGSKIFLSVSKNI